MDGIRLSALFSYMPNKLKYCGPDSASNEIYEFIINNQKQDRIRKLLIKFEALSPYLKIISEENSKDIFDYEVVEAYWIGNKLSDLNKQCAIKAISMLNKRGLTDSAAKKLISKINDLKKEKIPLTHLFNVMFVGVGAVTKSVPTIVENMDKCRISWGTVYEIHDSYLKIKYNRLKSKNNKYFISKNPEKIKAAYDKNFFNNLTIKDTVAVHWGMAVKKLSLEELNKLKHYTQKTIELISMP